MTLWLRVFPVAAAIFFVNSVLADEFGVELRARRVVGNELRLVVETYRTVSRFYSHTTKTADAKGYAIFVDLSSTKPLAERARIYGPLWEVPDARSSLSFSAGAHFTDADTAAARATPYCMFDTNGNLLRLVRSKNDVLVCDEFVADRKNGTWKRQRQVKVIPDNSQFGSDDRLVSFSERFVLLFQPGEAKLFDNVTGEELRDAWLTKAFAEVRSNKNFHAARLLLTDDLNHLVVSPDAGRGSLARNGSSFEVSGNRYGRDDSGVAFSRPSLAPVVFHRAPMPENPNEQEPHGAFTIDKELFLLMNDEKALRLYTLDRSKEFRMDANGKAAWPTYPFLRMQHVPDTDVLIFFCNDFSPGEPDVSEFVTVVEWRYRAGTIVRHEIHFDELFKKSWGKLRPRSVIPVRS